ncbi:MAG: LysM peptidoglycan-binding domain-containing protein [Verrucomicrobiota bacterium]
MIFVEKAYSNFIFIFILCIFGMWGVKSYGEENSPQIYGSSEKTSEPAPPIVRTPEKEESPATTSSSKKTVVLPLNEDEKPPQRKSYQVQRGDTLWKITRNTGISLSELKRLNHLNSDLIHVGDILILEDNPLEIRKATPITKEIQEHVVTPSDLNPPRVEDLRSLSPPVLPAEKPPMTKSPGGAPSISSSTTIPPVEKPKNVTPLPVAPAVPVVTLKERFLGEIRKMIADRVHYNGSWRPEGSDRNWVMDCSNTTRYLFYKIFKLDIGRTASEQYYRLKVKGRAWDVPQDSSGRPDIEYLHANLKVGDLLFWEHTYSPEREPPITHVTVYLGMDESGRFLMAGSEQGKGLLDQNFNGPDMYYFNPLAEKGGHSRFLFFGWKPGRFVAHGRPLGETTP